MTTEPAYGPVDARWDLDHVLNRVNNIAIRLWVNGNRSLAVMVEDVGYRIDHIIEQCDKISSGT